MIIQDDLGCNLDCMVVSETGWLPQVSILLYLYNYVYDHAKGEDKIMLCSIRHRRLCVYKGWRWGVHTCTKKIKRRKAGRWPGNEANGHLCEHLTIFFYKSLLNSDCCKRIVLMFYFVFLFFEL